MRNKKVELIAGGLILVAAGLGAWFLLNLKKPNASSAFFDIFGLWFILLASSFLSLIWLLRLMLRGSNLKAAGRFLVWQGIVGIVIISNFKSVDLNAPLLIYLATGLYFVSGLIVLVKANKLAPPSPNDTAYPPIPRRKGLSRLEILLLVLIAFLIVSPLLVFGGIAAGRPVPTPTIAYNSLTPAPTFQPTPTPRAIYTGAPGQTINAGLYSLTVTQVEWAASYGEIKARPGYNLVAVNLTLASSYKFGVDLDLSYHFYLKDGNGITYRNLPAGKTPLLPNTFYSAEVKSVSGWRTFEIPDTVTHLTLEYHDEGFGDFKALLSVDLGNVLGVAPITPTPPK